MSGETRTIAVLLVEDDEGDYVLTRRLLEQARGCRFGIVRAASLADARESLARTPCDVVLLDMSLPDSSGLETLRAVHEAATATAIVVLTGYEDDRVAVDTIHRGAEDYLVKGTVTSDGIARSIRYAIERKAAAESLKQYRSHLEELVDERTAELKAANALLVGEVDARRKTEADLRDAIARLEDLDRAKSRFVTNVSHELRTPLTSMIYAVGNLLRGVKGPLPDGVRDYLGMLRDDAQRLRGTVGDILDLRRIEAGTLILDRVNVPFARFVRRTVADVLAQAEAQGTPLAVHASRGTGFVQCDPTKMKRAILNVVRNAIAFSPDGGPIDVSVGIDPADPSFLSVSVEDQGIGIPPEFIDRVTERYVRVGEHVEGTGLGLAVVKEVANLHGGRLTIASPPPGKTAGTRVTISLPRGSPVRALVVDDEDGVRDLLRRQLTVDGYEVFAVGNAVGVVGAIIEHGVGILVLDLNMSGAGGVGAIHELKASPDVRHIPIVVLTGAEIDPVTRELLEAFSIPAMAKPWDQETLLNCLEESIIGKHYLER